MLFTLRNNSLCVARAEKISDPGPEGERLRAQALRRTKTEVVSPPPPKRDPGAKLKRRLRLEVPFIVMTPECRKIHYLSHPVHICISPGIIAINQSHPTQERKLRDVEEIYPDVEAERQVLQYLFLSMHANSPKQLKIAAMYSLASEHIAREA
jgi:hypothetical protein